jgi:hypothetical protein
MDHSMAAVALLESDNLIVNPLRGDLPLGGIVAGSNWKHRQQCRNGTAAMAD